MLGLLSCFDVSNIYCDDQGQQAKLIDHDFYQVGLSSDWNESSPETAWSIHVPFLGDHSNGFFGLYQGDRNAWVVSRSAKCHLHKLLENEIISNGSSPNIRECFETAYAKMDAHLQSTGRDRGTSATTCMIRKHDNKLCLYVSNVGDTRAILCRLSETIRLTKDHIPSAEEERKRLAESQSFVNSSNNTRGLFRLSRALGSHLLKQWIISKPDYMELDLTQQDSMVILVSHGVSEVMSDVDTVKVAQGRIPASGDIAQAMSDSVLEEAQRRGGKGNLVVMVIRLDWNFNGSRLRSRQSSWWSSSKRSQGSSINGSQRSFSQSSSWGSRRSSGWSMSSGQSSVQSSGQSSRRSSSRPPSSTLSVRRTPSRLDVSDLS